MSAPAAKKAKVESQLEEDMNQIQKYQDQLEKLDKGNKDKEKFWARALANHPFLAPMMSTEEVQIMSSLTRLDVQEDEDIKSGFTLRFTFAKNDYFKNEFIEKKFHMDNEGNVDNSTTEIEWHKGKNILEQAETESEFIQWLSETSEDNSDDVADLIKDDLWQNPYQYFLGIEESDDEEVTEE